MICYSEMYKQKEDVSAVRYILLDVNQKKFLI